MMCSGCEPEKIVHSSPFLFIYHIIARYGLHSSGVCSAARLLSVAARTRCAPPEERTRALTPHLSPAARCDAAADPGYNFNRSFQTG